MSWYAVPRPADPYRPTPSEGLALALVAIALAVVSSAGLLRVPVLVDGELRTMPAGSTVGDLSRLRLGKARPGDLIGVDGRTVRTRGGGPPVALIGGRVAEESRRITPGERIRTRDGADVTERIVREERPIPIPVEVTGKGPLVRLASTGAVGMQAVRVGEVSRAVVSSETIMPPVPMTVVRVTPEAPSSKLVALTFDDGPWPGSTAGILDVLKAEGVKATFFMVGSRVSKQPGTARRVAREGHLIGNHTLSHVNLARADARTVRRQVRAGANAIKRATGVRPKWFRPPGGHLDSTVVEETHKVDEQLVLWSVDPQDWRRPNWKRLAGTVVADTRPGAVVLLHDGGGDRSATVKALRRIIRRLKERGYRFVTLDELQAEQRKVARS